MPPGSDDAPLGERAYAAESYRYSRITVAVCSAVTSRHFNGLAFPDRVVNYRSSRAHSSEVRSGC